METVWQKHFQVLVSFGREFLMKFDSVTKRISPETARSKILFFPILVF
jgi:hypothetical protein